MERKFETLQAQFPASFPDSFKTLFAMVGEDEDHWDMFSTLLEDKVIPRVSRVNHRRFGGSLRCTQSTPSHPDGRDAAIVTRSNSFRHNRPRNNSYSRTCKWNRGANEPIGKSDNITFMDESNKLFCKHIKYCCLHQQHQYQHEQKRTPAISNPHATAMQMNLYTAQQPEELFNEIANETRFGPDGEDTTNDSVNIKHFMDQSKAFNLQDVQTTKYMQNQNTITNCLECQLIEHGQQRNALKHFPLPAKTTTNTTTPKASSSASTKTPLKPILKNSQKKIPPPPLAQPQTVTANSTAPPPLAAPSSSSSSALSSSLTSVSLAQLAKMNRQQMLPRAPKEIGAFHTKEQARQRVQQQFGIFKNIDTTDCSALKISSLSSMSNKAVEAVASNDTDIGNATSMVHKSDSKLDDFKKNINNDTKCDMQTDHQNEKNISHICSTMNVYDKGSITTSISNATGGAAAATSAAVLNENFICNTENIAPKRPSENVACSLAFECCHLNDFSNQKSINHQSSTNRKSKILEQDTVNSNYDKKFTQQYMPINYTHKQSKPITIKTRNNLGIKLTNMDELHMHDFSTSWTSEKINKVEGKPSEADKKYNTSFIKANTRNSHIADGAVSSTKNDKNNVVRCSSGPDNDNNNMTSKENNLQAFEKANKETSLQKLQENSPTADDNDLSTFQDSYITTQSSFTSNAKSTRTRTSSMPVEGRKPRLADMRRTAIHCADMDLEYYRLRSFSITSHGVCNLGDLLRSRRSRSNNSVTSTGTSNSGRERHSSSASRGSGEVFQNDTLDKVAPSAAYKIAMLGSAGVGKTTLSYQFTTSEYICAYDLSLDDDYGQKTVSVLVDNVETDLEIIDHPACEMSVESFCSTYRIDLFVIVYSIVDRGSFKAAEKTLQYLKENEMLMIRGAILVGNKTDLERHREVTPQMGRKLAKEIACKFIETSSGLDHNVNELLVGIVAQVKLNTQRIRNLTEFDRQRLLLQNCIQEHRHMNLSKRRFVRQLSMHPVDNDNDVDDNAGDASGDDDDEGVDKNEDTTWDDQFRAADDEATEKENQGLIRTTSTQKLVRNKIKERFDYSSMLSERTAVLNRNDTAQKVTNDNRSNVRSLNNSPKRKNRYDYYKCSTSTSKTLLSTSHLADEQFQDNFNRKSVSKLSDRTKGFFSSVLKFKKAMNMKRRSSSSCSDLFVI